MSLQYLIRVPDTQPQSGKAILLLHGVGSNEKDLFSLAGSLPADHYIIAPRGPFTLNPGRYAWFQVDFSSGKPVIDPRQECTSRDILQIFIGEITRKYRLKEIYLGGFSQGA